MISQNQQSERDRIRADLDYQVNLKAHQEVMQLHQKVDRLEEVIQNLRSDADDRPTTVRPLDAQPLGVFLADAPDVAPVGRKVSRRSIPLTGPAGTE